LKTLSVKAVGDVLVPDYTAAEADMRRFVGRSLEFPWPATGACIVADRPEYRQALACGDLELCEDPAPKKSSK
jgi:hypothetical protein